ncbi:MAG TPA: nuclear transport factor 2 family protein [Paracoccaceae bacterium]|nr:nuclear transport factor 2 family protein [Paracoccaceae bacterium]
MSNIPTVQAIYAAFGRGDIAEILSHLAEDVEWEHDWGMEPLPLYRPRRGRAEVPGFFAELAKYEFLRFEPQGFLEGAGMVAVPIQLELKVKATGRPIRDLEMHLWTFGPEGKVTRFRHLVDTRQFEAAQSP